MAYGPTVARFLVRQARLRGHQNEDSRSRVTWWPLIGVRGGYFAVDSQ